MKSRQAVYIDSFSGPVADLKGAHRTSANVLIALKKNPRLSTWDMSEHAWLRSAIAELKRSDSIVEVDESYPWHRYQIVEPKP